MIDQKLLLKVKQIVANVAEDKRMTAGYNGEHHDGGAKALLKELNAFQCGINQRFPESWEEYIRKAQKELEIEELLDVEEYQEYLRLKNKYDSLD